MSAKISTQDTNALSVQLDKIKFELQTAKSVFSDLFDKIEAYNDGLREINQYIESVNHYQKIISTINSIEIDQSKAVQSNQKWKEKKEEWINIYNEYQEKQKEEDQQNEEINYLFTDLLKKQETISPEQSGTRPPVENYPHISYKKPNSPSAK